MSTVKTCPFCGGSGRIRNTDPTSSHSGTYVHVIASVKVFLVCNHCKGTGYVAQVKVKNSLSAFCPVEAVAFCTDNNIVIVPKESITRLDGYAIKAGFADFEMREIPVISLPGASISPASHEKNDGRAFNHGTAQKAREKVFPQKTGQSKDFYQWHHSDVLAILRNSIDSIEARKKFCEKYEQAGSVPTIASIERAVKRLKLPLGVDVGKSSKEVSEDYVPIDPLPRVPGKAGYVKWKDPRLSGLLKSCSSAAIFQEALCKKYNDGETVTYQAAYFQWKKHHKEKIGVKYAQVNSFPQLPTINNKGGRIDWDTEEIQMLMSSCKNPVDLMENIKKKYHIYLKYSTALNGFKHKKGS